MWNIKPIADGLCNTWEGCAGLEHRCADINARYQQQLDSLPGPILEKQTWSSLESSMNNLLSLQGEPSHPRVTKQQKVRKQETTCNLLKSP